MAGDAFFHAFSRVFGRECGKGVEKREGKLGAYAMKHVIAGVDRPTPSLLSSRNAQMIEPTTDYAGVFFLSANTRYSFVQLSGLERALQSKHGANSGEVPAQ